MRDHDGEFNERGKKMKTQKKQEISKSVGTQRCFMELKENYDTSFG